MSVQKLDRKGTKVVMQLFGVLAVIFLATASSAALHTRSFLRQAVTGTATVIELKWIEDTDANTNRRVGTYHPVFRFLATDDQTYTVQSQVGSNPAPFEINQIVPIVYPRESPTAARINSFWQLWLFPVIFAGLGGTFALMALIGLTFNK